MLVMLTYNNFVSSSNTIFRRYSMAKRKFKKYSTQEKVTYYKNRMYDRSISEDQRFYSRTWLSGFLDNYADNNSECGEKFDKLFHF